MFPNMLIGLTGIVKFFDSGYKINKYDTTLLPYKWNQDLYFKLTAVLRCQSSLRLFIP